MHVNIRDFMVPPSWIVLETGNRSAAALFPTFRREKVQTDLVVMRCYVVSIGWMHADWTFADLAPDGAPLIVDVKMTE
jgi:hypothetical protein